jgi:hypothetical protein
MVEMMDDQTIYMTEVHRLIGSETREAVRKREYRESLKAGKRDNVPQLSQQCPTEKDIDIEKDIELDSNTSAFAQDGKQKAKRFVKPTVEEVREYCQDRGNTVDPETFVNFYESKGWVVGKSPMKDWKAAVRNWERSRTETTPPQETYSSFETDEFFQAALERTRRAMAADN